MPKKAIDYSKAVVYRLTYNDITYYVGSTTNMAQRKSGHKYCSTTESCSKYNMEIYKFIRENGGWGEWKMIQIESYPNCKTSDELRMYENTHYEFYKPELNSNKPFRSVDEKIQYFVDNKDKIKDYKRQYAVDNKEIIKKKSSEKYTCECGRLVALKQKSRHIRTQIHNDLINSFANDN